MKKATFYIMKCNSKTGVRWVEKVKGYTDTITDRTGTKYEMGFYNLGVKKWVSTHLETGLAGPQGSSKLECVHQFAKYDISRAINLAIEKHKPTFDRLCAEAEEKEKQQCPNT